MADALVRRIALGAPSHARSGPAAAVVRAARELPAVVRRSLLWGGVARLLWVAYAARVPRGLSDPALYYSFGDSIARGDGYRSVLGDPTAYYPPGYPTFLAVVFRLADFAHLPRMLCVGVAQALLGTITVFAVYRIAAWTLSERAGRAAAVVVAMWPNLIVYSAAVLSETLFLAAVAVSWWSSIAVVRRMTIEAVGSRWRERARDPRLAAWLGSCAVSSGVAAFVRPQALLFPVLLIGFVAVHLLRGVRKASGADLHRLEASAIGLAAASMLCGWMVMAVPWTLRNADVFGEFIPMSNNLGDNMCIGFQDGARGYFEIPPICDLPVAESGAAAEYARSQRNAGIAIESIKNDPSRLPLISVRKVTQTFAADHDGRRAVESFGDNAFLPSAVRGILDAVSDAFYALVLGAACIGLAVRMPRLRRGTTWLSRQGMWSCALWSGLAVPVLTFGEARYKAGVVPSLVIAAVSLRIDPAMLRAPQQWRPIRDRVVLVAPILAIGILGVVTLLKAVFGAGSASGAAFDSLMNSRALLSGEVRSHGAAIYSIDGDLFGFRPGPIDQLLMLPAAVFQSVIVARLTAVVLLVGCCCLAVRRVGLGWGARAMAAAMVVIVAMYWSPSHAMEPSPVAMAQGPLLLYLVVSAGILTRVADQPRDVILAVLMGTVAAQLHPAAFIIVILFAAVWMCSLYGAVGRGISWSSRQILGCVSAVAVLWLPMFFGSGEGWWNLAQILDRPGGGTSLIDAMSLVGNRLIQVGLATNGTTLGVERDEAVVVAAILLAGLVVSMRSIGKRRQVAAIGTVLLVGAVLATMAQPDRFGWWAANNLGPIDLCAALGVLFVGCALVPGGEHAQSTKSTVAVAMGVALLTLVIWQPARSDIEQWRSLSVKEVVDQVDAYLDEHPGQVAVLSTVGNGLGWYSSTEEVTWELRKRGHDARSADTADSTVASLRPPPSEEGSVISLRLVLGDGPVNGEVIADYAPDVTALRAQLLAELGPRLANDPPVLSQFSHRSEADAIRLALDLESISNLELALFAEDYSRPLLPRHVIDAMLAMRARLGATVAVTIDDRT